MTLCEINIHHLRNISSTKLFLNPHCNIFYGSNGSGKTSLLESLYLLSCGHSFRTREILPLIKFGEETLTIFSHLSEDQTISIQKSLSGPTKVKLNREPCYNNSVLARFLPCQVFYQDIFQIIDAGPSVRRALLDWGLFHVEQSYHSVWKDYRQILKQRNALLRQKAPRERFIPWDSLLVEHALKLDAMRSAYFIEWASVFKTYLQRVTDLACDIRYYKGWDKKQSGKSLMAILDDQFLQDSQQQYTHAGAHQADIYFDVGSKKAKPLLSRGQQKIILIALKLAQSHLIAKPCLYLFDDMTAELDSVHWGRLIDIFSELKGQLFFTALSNSMFLELTHAISSQEYKIEQGSFSRI